MSAVAQRRERPTLIRIGFAAAMLTAALDQALKLWLLFVFDLPHRGVVRITPFFDLVLVWNTGISYGLFRHDGQWGPWVLLGVNAAAVIMLTVWLLRSSALAAALGLGLIIGGAIGNSVDRLAYGAVVDFALLHMTTATFSLRWYVFNLADAAIVAGVALLLYDSFLGRDARRDAAKAP